MKATYSHKYQLIVEYPFSLDSKKQKEDLVKLEKEIEKKGMKVSFSDWGEKELAYKIEENEKARFWIGNVEAVNDVLTPWKDIRVFLNRNKQIIRYLILKI